MRWWWTFWRSSSRTGSRRGTPMPLPVVCTSWRRLYRDIWEDPRFRLVGASSLVGHGHELGELLQAASHARLRGVDDRGHALVDRLQHHDVARNEGVGLHGEGPLDLAHVQLHLGVGP